MEFKNRSEIEGKQFSLKMKLAKLKKKSFASRGEENKFRETDIVPLQKELILLEELWSKAEFN